MQSFAVNGPKGPVFHSRKCTCSAGKSLIDGWLDWLYVVGKDGYSSDRNEHMTRPATSPSGREISFAPHELIVSKTDPRGVITYANDVFLRVAGYSEAEVLGKPHNFIRHPDMPGAVFSLLWDTLKSGNEIFAYVVNMARNGDHYWVFAHVTPSYDATGKLIGYHSNRRAAFPDALPKVRELYAILRREEQKHRDPPKAAEAGRQLLAAILADQNITYAEFVFGLSKDTRLVAA